MPKLEIEFDKYKKRGDYHWRGITKNIFQFNAFLIARYQIILNLLEGIGKNSKILDLGCGDGVLSYLIKIKKGGKISGIDPSLEAIKIAQNKFSKLSIKNCSFKIGSGYNLPFKNNSFDYAVLADVIEHLQKPKKALKEAYRVLKPNGKIVISSVIKKPIGIQDKMHTKEYSPEELKSLSKKKFRVIQLKKSHSWIFQELYQFNFRIGKYRPQPFRYFFNIFTFLTGKNPFLFNIGNNFCNQTILAVK